MEFKKKIDRLTHKIILSVKLVGFFMGINFLFSNLNFFPKIIKEKRTGYG